MNNGKSIRAEFHVHTRYSKDSILNQFLILLMCKLRKIKLLALTDHNEIAGAIKYKEFLNKYGIDVIVGEEIMTKYGEIIGLYLKEKIQPNLSVLETITKIKEQGGLIYLPHPYDEKRYKTVLKDSMQEKYKEYFSFIEIHNGRNIKKEFDIEQENIQKSLGIIPIIGSDAHTFFELGRNYININYNGKDCLENSVKNCEFHKKKCIMFAHRWTKIARLIKIIEKGDFNELRGIINRRGKRKNK